MRLKLQALEKYHKLEQDKKNLTLQQLDSMHREQAHSAGQLQRLQQLRKQTVMKPGSGGAFCREMLLNYSRVDQMLGKMILHQEQEQALKKAQCTSLQKQLEQKQARLKGLENTLEHWQKEFQFQEQKLEDLALEELINTRFAVKPL